MPRKKVEKQAETNEQTVEIKVPAPRKRGGKSVGVQQVVTAYSKEVMVDEDDSAFDDDDDLSAAAAVEDAVPADPVEAFLAEFAGAGDVRWEMIVYHLPSFDKDGRADTTAPGRERMGRFPFNPDTFEDEIAANCAQPGATNVFAVEIRRNGNYYKVLPTRRIRPASLFELQQRGVQLPPAINPVSAPALPAVNPFDEVDKVLSLAAKMREAFGAPATAPAPPPPPALTEEMALAHLVNTDGKVFERFKKGIASKLLDTGAGETNIYDVIKAGLENGQTIIREIFAGVKDVRAVPSGSAPAPVQPLNPVPPSPALAPESEQRQLDVPAIPPEILTLDALVRFCAQQTDSSLAADWLIGQAELFPQVNQLIDFFLTLSPAEAVDFAVQAIPPAAEVMKQPHAQQWIAELQRELKERSEEDGETDNAQFQSGGVQAKN